MRLCISIYFVIKVSIFSKAKILASWLDYLGYVKFITAYEDMYGWSHDVCSMHSFLCLINIPSLVFGKCLDHHTIIQTKFSKKITWKNFNLMPNWISSSKSTYGHKLLILCPGKCKFLLYFVMPGLWFLYELKICITMRFEAAVGCNQPQNFMAHWANLEFGKTSCSIVSN